ncbi:DUF6340 family protein [Alkalitalea saponilacus]|uniref:Uncharacterized protein n=1 Tax=Alkalitalea saponilacus TaxID=889453 RepID=A0A1T5D760_9BACT|nr:DUF6340 family protein [Alkalitalea saponilacus]ASB50604.1 hypothetical protein CDL62_16355 [Alkalitalea saponilacus]SKB67509.1 hypothetical protein SAMN03080601_01008 [Alkalitalea saponilacus]
MGLKKIKKSLGFILLPFVFSACSTMSYIEIDVLRPAEYSMAPDILSVVAVDYAYPHRSDSMHIFYINNDTIIADSIWVDDFGIRAVQSMTKSLQQMAFFDTVYFYSTSLNLPPNGDPNRPIPLNEIRRILSEYDAQVLIALEKINYSSEVNVTYLNQDVYFGTLDIYGAMFWKIYDENGYILDVYLQKDTLFWNNYPTYLNQPHRNLPEIREGLNTMANFMGQEYTTRIAPYWESVYRPYYRSGHHMFDRANDLVNINNWNQAGRVWYYVYENGNNRQKTRAAFNLAVAFEVSGNFDESLAWARVSQELMNNLSSLQVSSREKQILSEYIKELERRINDSKKLQEQLGAGF